MKTKLILCPVDFSPSSQMAVQVAGRLARMNDANLGKQSPKVILLHITDSSSKTQTLAENFATDTQQRLRDEGRFDPATKVEYLTLKGKPGSAIVEFAKKKKVDLIVMGTRGHSRLRKLLVGSVAQDVLDQAPCPVITVKL
jgi:nucleotide-binding universal stress UspA family protein